ncbi:MAG: OsmC family protein [Candidatus Thorarchaeota archaeon]|nr:MAG: OsmC family protein [Candidatus Thorarchaeota archaeon]
MSEEPKEYRLKVAWDHERGGEAIFEGKPSLRVSWPKGFEGNPEYFSPEDLFVASATICFVNSFVYFTKRMHIEFKAFECEGTGTLEQVGRSFEITKIINRARVVIESEELRSKFERALYLGAKYCFVANSMKCPVAHEGDIVVEP